MKQDKKILSLLEHGFNSTTLAELNPKQINALYVRLVETKEQTDETTMVSAKNPGEIEKLKKDGATFEVYEDIDNEISEKFESKKQQKYFFAKCGDGKTKEQKKWCKMAKEFSDSTKNFSKLPNKKEETNEEFTFGDYFNKLASVNASKISQKIPNTMRTTFESKLEESVIKMIKNHITPKISKKDFVKTIVESNKEKEIQAPPKPDVKPDKPKPATPYQPKHKPAPRAKDLPDWLSFDSIGLDI